MKKEESKVIAQKLQKIPNGTLSIERTQAGKNMGETCFSEQIQAVTTGKGRIELHNVYPGIEASFNTFFAPEIHFQQFSEKLRSFSSLILSLLHCKPLYSRYNSTSSPIGITKIL